MTAEEEFKSKGSITKKITIPLLMWEEWEEDCLANFNNTYSSKMQFDHEFRKQFNTVANLLMQDVLELKEEVFELKARIHELENKPVEKKKSNTFG